MPPGSIGLGFLNPTSQLRCTAIPWYKGKGEEMGSIFPLRKLGTFALFKLPAVLWGTHLLE